MGDAAMRKSCHNKLVTILNAIKAHPVTPLTINSATQYMERSKEVMDKAEEAQFRLIALCTDDAAIAVQESAFAPVEVTYHELRCRLKDILDVLPPPASSSSSSHGAAGHPINVKLPQLEVPTFDGNYADWMSFKDLFTATVDNNTHISPAQKLQYLKLSLQSEPANLIRNMIITDENYKEAWKILKERYDNEREIVASLARKLFDPKPLSRESASGLQQLLDNTIECLRALNVLKQPTDHWDTLIIAMLTSKLDPATHREWAIRNPTTTVPTFKEFSTFLMNHIRGLNATGARAGSMGQSGPSRKEKNVGSHHVMSTNNKCLICEGTHQHFQCQQFQAMQPSERSALAAKLHLCFNCLRAGHSRKGCPIKFKCKKCGKPHHTMLHEDKRTSLNAQVAPSTAEEKRKQQYCSSNKEESQLSSNLVTSNTHVLLPTAIVLVNDINGEAQPCRAFLDSGSQASFIAEDCVNRLGLHRSHSRIPIKGISSSCGGTTKGKVFASLRAQKQKSDLFHMELHILSKVTGDMPSVSCRVGDLPHLRGIQLADPCYTKPERVDILIGANYFGHVMLDGRRAGPPSAPVALQTVFGWVITGHTPIESHHVIHSFPITAEDIIQRFWEVEEPPRPHYLTKEEKECDQHFLQHHSRDQNGRFIVGVPFNNKKETLGVSRFAAIRRLLQVERRLQRQPQHQQSYIEFMREYSSLGHMEKVPEEEIEEKPGKTFYLPHHFVINEGSSTTKLRVVFDGSAKSSSGISLNETILVGPPIQDELYGLLLRFRLHPVVLKADITKMFRQFQLRKEDADFHRIVWRESPNQPIEDFRLLTVTYGTACAPSLSTRCLKQLAITTELEHPVAAKVISNDTYVDDIMTGASDDASANQLYCQLNQVMGTACLELRKWSSNSAIVLNRIPEADRDIKPHSFDDGTFIKALGVQWDPAGDSFKFNHVPVNANNILTKRILLSDLSRVFDPLGLISPITVRAKLILQELWKLSCGWDDQVPESIQSEWTDYQRDMEGVVSLSFPRRITSYLKCQQQLHGFCDASERAYGAAVYLREISPDGRIICHLITSKTRVTPLRQISLPRLELMGALLLAELTAEIQGRLQLSCDIFMWTDSSITLKWISSQPRRWKTFIANRVAKIQECTPLSAWNHVPGIHNPADLCSRGVSSKDLQSSSFWNEGPLWLSEPGLPMFPINSDCNDQDLEERPHLVKVHLVNQDFSLLERSSSLPRLQRITAFIQRGFFNAKVSNRHQKKCGPFRVSDLNKALTFWTKAVQQQHFDSEIKSLLKTKEVHHGSPLRRLVPFLDNEGLLRVSGRLNNAIISDQHKHLIILPVSSHLSHLIIAYYHQLTLHGGFQLTFSTIYTKYWIQGGRNKVRFYIRSCVICRRHRAQSAQQLMGALPEVRVQPVRPFLNTGVDYAGPFLLKNPVGRAPKTYKGYICVFVCMVTKAIHLEAVSSLSTADFIATFRRFTSRRGICAHLYSDRGTNFIGADRELRSIVKGWESNPQVPDNLSTIGVTWHWSPPSAPHHGGLFEAGVKSAKFHLRRVIGQSPLTFEQFSTLLCRVESILNSRPLYPVSSDPTDISALTPGHFLIGESLLAVPDPDVDGIPTNRLNLYQRQQQQVQHFWRRWSRDYLTTLQQRNKWYWEKDNLKLGDLVLIVEETAPGLWKMGRITATHPGDDGRVRVVTVKTATSSFKRAIVKLIPLIQQ